jgi:hypothetical protein
LHYLVVVNIGNTATAPSLTSSTVSFPSPLAIG